MSVFLLSVITEVTGQFDPLYLDNLNIYFKVQYRVCTKPISQRRVNIVVRGVVWGNKRHRAYRTATMKFTNAIGVRIRHIKEFRHNPV